MRKSPQSQKQPKASKGLVGRYFHIFGDDGNVSRQGRVIDQIDPTHYLVQFYEWAMGAGTIHVVRPFHRRNGADWCFLGDRFQGTF